MLVAACRFVREETSLGQVISPQILFQNFVLFHISYFNNFILILTIHPGGA